MANGEPTHGEILRAIGTIEGQLKLLLDAATADKTERSSLGERVGRLEQRMAQVIIVAVVAATLSPLIWTEIRDAFRSRDQQQHSTHHPGATVPLLARSTAPTGSHPS
jgi:hypothetical protein